MAILKIAKLGHPVLIKKTNEINDLSSIDLKKIVFDMSQTCGVLTTCPEIKLLYEKSETWSLKVEA